MSNTIIPAQPGFYVLHVQFDPDCDWRMPVIAWHIEECKRGAQEDANVLVTPISSDGAENEASACCAILSPDGTVSNFTGMWETAEGWIQDARTNLKAEKTKAAA